MIPRNFAPRMLGVSMGRFARIVLRNTLEITWQITIYSNHQNRIQRSGAQTNWSTRAIVPGPDIHGQVTFRISLNT